MQVGKSSIFSLLAMATGLISDFNTAAPIGLVRGRTRPRIAGKSGKAGDKLARKAAKGKLGVGRK